MLFELIGQIIYTKKKERKIYSSSAAPPASCLEPSSTVT